MFDDLRKGAEMEGGAGQNFMSAQNERCVVSVGGQMQKLLPQIPRLLERASKLVELIQAVEYWKSCDGSPPW